MSPVNLLLLLPIVVSGYVLHDIRALGLLWSQQKNSHSYFRILLIGCLWSGALLPLLSHFPINLPFTDWLDDWLVIPGLMLMKPIIIAVEIRIIADILFFVLEKSSNEVRQHFGKRVMSRTFFSEYLYDFMVNIRWVLITLKNGKAYVGQIAGLPEPPVDWIKIYPLQSGYRDERKKLHLETDYLEAIMRAINSLEYGEKSRAATDNEIVVLIPMDQIVSIQRYEPDLEQHFDESDSQAENLAPQPQ